MIALPNTDPTEDVMAHRNSVLIPFSRRVILVALVSLAAFCFISPAFAKAPAEPKQEVSPPEYNRSTAEYKVPDVEIIRNDGKHLNLIKELDDGRPVMMNFIFASCSAICPMLSHVFMQVQNKLAKDKQNLHLMSISIDPENDTPSVLNDYAKKFKAGSQWDFYTGTLKTSKAIQEAFNVYRGDKMNHASVILIRPAPGKPWLRLDGFASPEAVIREYHMVLEDKK